MAAPMNSDTSSEDEESSAMFREAVTNTKCVFPKASAYQEDVIQEKTEVVPSKRPDKEETEYDDVQQGMAPGLRQHISQKLTDAIDSNVEYTESIVGSVSSQESENVVKLFTSSSRFLLEKNSSVSEDKKPTKKRPVSSSSDCSSEDERLAEASVSHDFIMQQKDEPYPASQKPPDIIIKSPCSDKQLTCISDKNTHLNKMDVPDKHMSNGSSNTSKVVDSAPVVDEIIDGKQTKKAKKKRKKHKKEKTDS